MVKRNFSDLDIECWLHPGKLGLAEPSLCLFHDKIEHGLSILDALDELANDGYPAKRTLTFKPCVRPRRFLKLGLSLCAESSELKVFHISCDRRAASVQMTVRGLVHLRDAVARWRGGAEDFGVDPHDAGLKKSELGPLDLTSGSLWFWGPLDTVT